MMRGGDNFMLIFILILILIAILYSTERGRELLEEIFLLPFKIIGYPFKLVRAGRERAQAEKFAKEEQEDNDKIKILLSKNQREVLDEEKVELSWRWDKEKIIGQAKFFENILEGGQDPRVLNLGENFSYIKEDVLNKTKEDLVENGKNLTPEVLQYIRKQMGDDPLKYEEIREKLGKIPVIGAQTKNRIIQVLKESTDLDQQKIDKVVSIVLKHFGASEETEIEKADTNSSDSDASSETLRRDYIRDFDTESKGVKILLINKDPFSLAMYSTMLEKEGFNIATRMSANGDNGDFVSDVFQIKPDVIIILEIVLPERDGVEAINLLKQDPRTEVIPIIVFIFGYQLPHIKDIEEEGKIIGYILKGEDAPDPQERVEEVKRLINNQPKKPRLLMVDEDKFILEMYSNKFRKVGVEFHGLPGPKDRDSLIDTVLEFKPDLITMDIIMPIMDGFEAVELLKSDPRTKDFPIMILSFQKGGEDVERARASGAVGCIVPLYLAPNEIVEVITNYMKNPSTEFLDMSKERENH